MKRFVTLAAVMAAFTAANAQAAFIPADIVFVFDASGSMAGDMAEVKSRIVQFNTAMVNNGIDAHYGLVSYVTTGGADATLDQDVVDFTTFNQAGGPFQSLTTRSGTQEKGSAATSFALANLTFRAGSVKNIILITDEDDDSSLAQFNAADAALTASRALFNFIGVPGVGNTDSRYGALAAGHGGAAFSINDFRNNPDPFFTNFINTKVQEIKNVIPEPTSLALFGLGTVGLGFVRRRRRELAA